MSEDIRKALTVNGVPLKMTYRRRQRIYDLIYPHTVIVTVPLAKPTHNADHATFVSERRDDGKWSAPLKTHYTSTKEMTAADAEVSTDPNLMALCYVHRWPMPVILGSGTCTKLALTEDVFNQICKTLPRLVSAHGTDDPPSFDDMKTAFEIRTATDY
jgi:hypothetical protein